MNDFVKEPPAPPFGGDWSDQKLSALSSYLSAYTSALKNQNFSLVYIDAFAGAGSQGIPSQQDQLPLLAEMEEMGEEERQYRHGSPFVALRTEPPFDEFVFIDKNERSLQNLRDQIARQNHEEKSISYLAGDANEKLIALCNQNWKSRRAVAFIDPFATEVKWRTIEMMAKTKAIDLWLLFPAMAVNRMLTKTGEMPQQWQEKLTECFGTDEWKEAFYKPNNQRTLFEDKPSTVKVENSFAILNQFVKKRLKSVFPGVGEQNLILKNSKNAPLFLLCFACSNPKAVRLALKIANHIIGTSR